MLRVKCNEKICEIFREKNTQKNATHVMHADASIFNIPYIYPCHGKIHLFFKCKNRSANSAEKKFG